MLGQAIRADRLLRQGQRYTTQDKLDEAMEALTQVVTLRPRAAPGYVYQALALSEASRLSEAVDAMQQALALAPRNPVFLLFLSQIYFDHAAYDDTKTWCERALALNPHNCHALGLSALTNLVRDAIPQSYQRLQSPVPLPVPFLERGLLWLTRGKIPSLLQQGNTALQSRVLLAVEQYLLQHETAARTLSQQLVTSGVERQVNPIVLWFDHLLTRGVMGLRRLYTALRYAAQPAARSTNFLALRAEEAMYLGDMPTAQQGYTQLLQQAPELLQVRHYLVDVCYEQGDFRQALAHLQRLLKDDAGSQAPTAWQSLLLGDLLYQVGRYQEAAAALTRAEEGKQRDYKLFYYRGLCQLRNGATRAARRSFAQAVAMLNPDIATLRLEEMYRVYQQQAH